MATSIARSRPLAIRHIDLARGTDHALRRATGPARKYAIAVIVGVVSTVGACAAQIPAARGASPRCVLQINRREVLQSADGRRLTVNIESIAANASAVAMVGLPTALLATDGKADSKTDSLLGAVWSPLAGHTIGIPIPTGLQPMFPRIAAAASGWHVIFFVASPGSVAGALPDADLWYGHFNGKWEVLERVASYKGMTAYPSLAPDLAARQGEIRFAFPYEENDSRTTVARKGGLIEARWAASTGWRSDTIQTPTTPSYVRIIGGATDSHPFITGAVHSYADADSRLRPSALMLRGLSSSRSPVRIGAGAGAVRTPSLAVFGNRMAVAWTTAGAREDLFYTSVTATGSLAHAPRLLANRVRGTPEAVGIDASTAMWLALDTDEGKAVRAWWYDGATATAAASILFRQPVFKFAAAKARSGPLFVAAAEVHEPQGDAFPATEVISATTRCGLQ